MERVNFDPMMTLKEKLSDQPKPLHGMQHKCLHQISWKFTQSCWDFSVKWEQTNIVIYMELSQLEIRKTNISFCKSWPNAWRRHFCVMKGYWLGACQWLALGTFRPTRGGKPDRQWKGQRSKKDESVVIYCQRNNWSAVWPADKVGGWFHSAYYVS